MYSQVLPTEILNYLDSANRCVNPKCHGVYFESCAELVKFVDFCGKYRVPLMQYLCSSHCSQSSPAYAFTESSSSDSEENLSEDRCHIVRYDIRTNRPGSSMSSSQAKMKKFY